MTNSNFMTCDGCGQLANSEHISRRLQRLEWATRYRPLHINTILLGAVSPALDHEFLYSSTGTFQGEALLWLAAAKIDPAGKSPEVLHAEFQKAGFFLTYVLECPLEKSADEDTLLRHFLDKRIASTATRIRRSFKPKRVALVSRHLAPYLSEFSAERLNCGVVLDGDQPFALAENPDISAVSRLATTLAPGLGMR